MGSFVMIFGVGSHDENQIDHFDKNTFENDSLKKTGTDKSGAIGGK